MSQATKTINISADRTLTEAEAANSLVVSDSSSAAVAVTLPASPPDGSQLRVANVGANGTTVSPGSGDTINSTTSLAIDTTLHSYVIEYNEADTNWAVVASHTPA